MSVVSDIGLSASVAAPVYGQPVMLTAQLGWFDAPGGALPSGTVTFLEGATVLGTAMVSAAGEANLIVATLAVGLHELTAAYAGDATFDPSTSAPISLPVTQATATVAVTPPQGAQAGRTLYADVLVAIDYPSTAAASGTVTVLEGSTELGSATLDGTSRASVAITLASGPRAITVEYSGSANIAPATAPAVVVEVLAGTSVDLVAVEDALHAWVKSALGLETVWSHANARAPGRPYGWLTLVGPREVGGPELVDETDLGRPAGHEVQLTVVQHEEWDLSVEVISAATSGPTTARALLGAAKARLRLPTALGELRSAGLAPVSLGDTQDLTALFGTAFESRARMTVRVRTVNATSETTGFIEQVGVSSSFGAWQFTP